ncbi:glycosyltransferase [Olivibacter sp. SDN3]|uniref:glycosyltransferase family 2 protein n=1 Tax=Olivibacter sp. SDN3 TaxID=2764720 RepID=UPI00165122F2|nr:glycosyltransferase [Olivibacter sp. SDN3]QNL47729.1 glycosyltransferase [Olivibacter sp. SDN3]
MYTHRSIDIVIPSFRLDENILANIINLEKPAGYDVHIYIVADNPNATIPQKITDLSKQGKAHLIKNDVNLGFSATRNKGILVGKSRWILLLDDDIIPADRLLLAYARAIESYPHAIGFMGVTNFPEPFNNITKALKINGSIGHFESAKYHNKLLWAPTANIVLNRERLTMPLFNEELKKGGEDIEFLLRNALKNKETYVACPEALVTHPWWNEGNIQTKRMFRYGIGASEISTLPVIKKYTYYDFTNTSETLLLLILALPFAAIAKTADIIFLLILITLLSEFITNLIKVAKTTGKNSFSITWHLFWVKNMYELGYLVSNLMRGNIRGFAKRIDMSFRKENPSWFRLNRWKIIKSLLLILFTLLAISLVKG